MSKQPGDSDDQPKVEPLYEDKSMPKESEEPEAGQVSAPGTPETEGQPSKEPEAEETKISLNDGTEVSIDELKAGYMKDADYRQKTAALKERERELAQTSQTPESTVDSEVTKAVEVLKQAGVATKEDLAMLKAQQIDEEKLRKLLEANPELKSKEKAIRAIGNTTNDAWEDIVVKYGFAAKDKLAKAKASRPIVGDGAPKEPESKSIRDMSEQEYEAWKKQNLGGSGFFKKQ